MKTKIKNPFALPALIVASCLMLAGRAAAQIFTTLHSFTATNGVAVTNSDGATPYAGLILSGNTLYGTAFGGGSAGVGTVFTVHTDGTGFTTLHSFTAISGPNSTNSDGANPWAGLVLSGNTLYGTAPSGGRSGYGTVFAVNTDGTGFTTLHSFTTTPAPSYTNRDGAYPHGGLVLSGSTLYGTASQGGTGGGGTVFAVNTDGTGFTNLHSFAGYPSDGASPWARLVLSGNTLYGTAVYGGSRGNGMLFALNNDGSGFRNLHSFDGRDGHTPTGFILSGNTLYGTTQNDDIRGFGTVFKVNTDGTGFTTLHLFGGYPSDGANPASGLIVSGHTVYGTAGYGGSLGKGMVFALNTDGTRITNLHNFTDGSDGGGPIGGLMISGNTLYGTAYSGGSSGKGTVFSLSFPRPQLTISPSGTNVILSWSANVAGFDYTGYTLQSTTNLGSSAVWATNSPGPVVINGQNTVTNSISGTQQFFRLIQ